MARRVSDEQLLGAIGFVGVAAFFLSKAAVKGDESTTAGAPSPAAAFGPLLLLAAAVTTFR